MNFVRRHKAKRTILRVSTKASPITYGCTAMSDKLRENKLARRRGPKLGTCNNPNGRPAGSVNKVTHDVRLNFLNAFEQLGGVEGMVKWARNNPSSRSTFYQMYSKLLPTKVVGVNADGSDGPLSVNITFVKKDE